MLQSKLLDIPSGAIKEAKMGKGKKKKEQKGKKGGKK